MKSTSALGLALCLVFSALAGSAGAFSKESLVWQKCAGCHAPTAEGKLARVEEIRTTPEEWWVIVDRMKRLYGMELAKGEMDALLRELCSTQLLTPAELSQVSYLSLQHNSQRMEVPQGPEQVHLFATCVRCHSAGKVFSYRMTPEAWLKLRDFHHYVTPTVHLQMREMHWRPEAEKALGYLGRSYAYGRAWQAPPTRLEGSWFIVGREPGKGSYRGEAAISASQRAGDYTLKGKLEYEDGSSEDFEGDAVLYGDVALRTRTRHNGFETRGAYVFTEGELRGEHHFPAPHFRTSGATWIRKDSTPRVARVRPAFLLKGEKTTLTVEGTNLPEVKAADASFTGGAVRVLKAKRVNANALELQVVSDASGIGSARLKVKGLDAGPVRLAPRIDYIAVSPGTGRARLSGGPNYPAEGVQFEAIAYSRGAKAKDPKDDVALGPVPASFRLAEEKTRPGDDDLQWVGGIGPNGTYIPIGDYSPLASRKYHSEASGWVKVLARYAQGRQTYQAEGKLAVCVPDFIPRIR
ncbi:MAG: quinohemoprotein amine dehydrogenase subunit alpha [Deltaproteobacteria bacterium]|nr:quinohemoprotein amine dehydrogenase subunit alpha [Deltaproteobacteria bacterium]